MPALGINATRGLSLPAWLANLASFYAGWWAVVLAAAAGWPVAGITAVVALLCAHLLWTGNPRRELALILLAGFTGLAFDSLLQASGWVSFAGNAPVSWLAPPWMVALWMNFATTLNHSMRPLQGRPWLAAAFGAVGGPAAYWAGAEFGAMRFHDVGAALATLAIAWAALTPLLLAAAGRLGGASRS